MYAHPGKKLLFMGGEFGQFIEWRFAEGLDWLLLDYDSHKGMKRFTKELNEYYRTNRSMYENDSDWSGFEWINAEDGEKSVISFIRSSKSRRDKTIVVLNFAAQEHKKYVIGVPSSGEYEVVLNSDSKAYGGAAKAKQKLVTKRKAYKGFKYVLEVDLPELSAFYIKKVKTVKVSD